MASKMPQVYIHYFGTESSSSLLKAYGIEKEIKKNNSKDNSIVFKEIIKGNIQF